MPDEDDLRRMLRATDAPNTLDTKRIVARSRGRRLPRQIAAGTLGAFALAGVTVLAVQVTQVAAPVTMTAGEAFDQSTTESAPVAPDSTVIKRAPVDKINLCTGTVSDVAPSQYGLQLEVVSPGEIAAGTAPVAVTVRLTNTSGDRVVGSTAWLPAITLSQGGIVTWHTNGTTDSSYVQINLAPGESIEYTTTFTPVRCDVVDDEGESFRTGLPPAEAGEYALSALIDFTPDASMLGPTTELDLVSGPLTTFTIG